MNNETTGADVSGTTDEQAAADAAAAANEAQRVADETAAAEAAAKTNKKVTKPVLVKARALMSCTIAGVSYACNTLVEAAAKDIEAGVKAGVLDTSGPAVRAVTPPANDA